MSRQSTVLYTQLYCIVLHTVTQLFLCRPSRTQESGEGKARKGEECTGLNEVVLTVCLHQEESTCGGLETYSPRGEMNVAQQRPFFLDFCFPGSQNVHAFDVLGFFFEQIPLFSFPQCCNVGSHGSNFDVSRCFSLHTFVSSFHSLSQCPSNNEVVVTKLCFKMKKEKKKLAQT